MTDFYAEAFGWQMELLGEEMGNYKLANIAVSDGCGPRERGLIGIHLT
ncbi:hypothetical protein [Marinobacter halodurans]|nr:hypothetical protein [Marinobacter halodurans]